MELLFSSLLSGLFGECSGNLLNAMLKRDKVRRRAVDIFEQSDALCHRFFRLFQDEYPRKKRILETLAFDGDESLVVLLELT